MNELESRLNEIIDEVRREAKRRHTRVNYCILKGILYNNYEEFNIMLAKKEEWKLEWYLLERCALGPKTIEIFMTVLKNSGFI